MITAQSQSMAQFETAQFYHDANSLSELKRTVQKVAFFYILSSLNQFLWA